MLQKRRTKTWDENITGAKITLVLFGLWPLWLDFKTCFLEASVPEMLQEKLWGWVKIIPLKLILIMNVIFPKKREHAREGILQAVADLETCK